MGVSHVATDRLLNFPCIKRQTNSLLNLGVLWEYRKMPVATFNPTVWLSD